MGSVVQVRFEPVADLGIWRVIWKNNDQERRDIGCLELTGPRGFLFTPTCSFILESDSLFSFLFSQFNNKFFDNIDEAKKSIRFELRKYSNQPEW